MAVIKTGPIVADIRGSVGHETFARNQGGPYVRARSSPTGEPTDEQLACQATMTALSPLWSAQLSEQQRTAWRAYAHEHPRPNRWGENTITNGYARFIRLNFTRYHIDTALAFPDAPLAPPIHPPTFTFTAEDAGDTVTIDLGFPRYGGGIKNLQLFAYLGRQVNPGVNFYARPWQYIGTNRFNTKWQFEPWSEDSPWPLTEGKKVFLRMVAQMRDKGQLSEPYQTSTVVIA